MTILDMPLRPATAAAGSAIAAALDPQAEPWITATITPAGSFGREDADRLSVLLDALSASASIVVLDLRSASLRSIRAADVIQRAALTLELHGGCLLCVHADGESRRQLAASGAHAVILSAEEEQAGGW